MVPVRALFENRWFANIEGYDVTIPEVLLLLKSQAAKDRWGSEKGLKDRVDLLSLLLYSDWKPEILKGLVEAFNPDMKLVNVLARTVRESRAEYGYIGARYEREGRKLKVAVSDLLQS